jgi:hypothetical protein
MPQNTSLEELVLGYCRQVDGLVEPPAYGMYEVLLPDEVAARWGISPYQRFAFGTEADPENAGTRNAVHLHFGHPLVETIVDEIRTKTANGHFFINNVRPEKPKLYDVIEKAFALPNAKMFPVPGSAENASLHHYVWLNFKVSLIADEKRELILPLWMDLQGGFSVKGADLEHTALLDLENQFPDLPPADLIWSSEPPLSRPALTGLLERARRSVTFELGETLDSLQKRLMRFLELDRARLNDYYDDLNKDAERRLQKAEPDRRPALKAKLAAIASERQSKLADVEQKYLLRIQLELVNLAVIAQPKLDLTVEIRKRGVTVKRRVTWDPLLHTVEGLACEVCNRPGHTLLLCENGHLAHNECLAPQCVDCKRTFCQKCVGEVQTCVVCERPVCVHSLNRCQQCDQATCQAHRDLCHAEDGQPRKEIASIKTPVPTPKMPGRETEAGGGTKISTPETGKSPKAKPAAPKARPSFAKTVVKSRPEVAGDFMEVYSDPAQNYVSAVVKTKKRDLATREWSMSEEGLAVSCWCEKINCPERGVVYRPMEAERLTVQVNGFIEQFAEEYGVPVKKIHFFHIRQGQPVGEIRLKLPASWKDTATLERAWAGFEALRLKNRSRF